ncbi:HAMP domain-containing protein [Noviherbaspirillum sp. 17J57-3]|uniref:histidine kinase n=2 Tax=Noviherbaspirillum galbum TaxID=2709383 RepID=A0A6B3SPP4_9BURK|nr:HAMP domain-containing protein [Noviherbaspirillum galbum]
MRQVFQSMTGRVVLILVAGVVASALLTLSLGMSERERMISQFREFHSVERVSQFIQSLDTMEPELRSHYLKAASRLGMRAELASGLEDILDEPSRMATRLSNRLPEGYTVSSVRPRDTDCAPPGPRQPQGRIDRRSCEALMVTLQDGSEVKLTVSAPRPVPVTPNGEILTYGAMFVLFVGLLASIVARMTIQPLKHLAQAATELGNNIERPPLPERGSTEIRQAAAAFNAMQTRIRHHIKQRSHILGAITHDLQTPMTRLRLRLEKVDDEELRGRLIADLSAMQTMVREGLDLARSMESAEPLQRLDLDSLVESLCEDARDAGQSVALHGNTGASLMARPVALRRCLTNLLDNAVKYGHAAKVETSLENGFAMIRIRDQGPGIPDAFMEKVFDPFYRMEDSRSRETGGTGLGLTIARSIAEQHGGTISLRNHPAGGLQVTLALPASR